MSTKEDAMEPISLLKAAELTDVTPEALRYAARVTGTLKAEKKGRNWLTTRAAVEAWKESPEYHRMGRPRKK